MDDGKVVAFPISNKIDSAEITFDIPSSLGDSVSYFVNSESMNTGSLYYKSLCLIKIAYRKKREGKRLAVFDAAKKRVITIDNIVHDHNPTIYEDNPYSAHRVTLEISSENKSQISDLLKEENICIDELLYYSLTMMISALIHKFHGRYLYLVEMRDNEWEFLDEIKGI